MLDFPAPKTMAKALRSALAERDVALSHAQCLDVVARQLGFADWNVLAPRLDDAKPLVMPEGWFPAGHSSPEHFRMGIAPDMPGVALVETVSGTRIPDGATGVLMQAISAAAFAGKRLRLTAELKTRMAGSGTIWMRVDPKGGGGRFLAFDNTMGRRENGPLTGDTDWSERAIVLDVPEDAESVHFGFLLKAPGSLWGRAVRLEAVGQDVPVTGGRNFPPEPTNLGFE